VFASATKYMKIAIIGTGIVGKTITTKLLELNHCFRYG